MQFKHASTLNAKNNVNSTHIHRDCPQSSKRMAQSAPTALFLHPCTSCSDRGGTLHLFCRITPVLTGNMLARYSNGLIYLLIYKLLWGWQDGQTVNMICIYHCFTLTDLVLGCLHWILQTLSALIYRPSCGYPDYVCIRHTDVLLPKYMFVIHLAS